MQGLPQLLATLGNADSVDGFPGLRPHQRSVWHAFLVQLAAIALHRAGLAALPEGADDWAGWLRGLTPEWPGDEPWCLVAPPDAPAFLQAPVPSGDLSAFRNWIEAPDALDMLVTSKNHDLKSSMMVQPEPDDWVYALVSLQTQEGFMGAGKYGIARMNGGFSNRTFVSVEPPGGVAARFRRDLTVALRQRAEFLKRVPSIRGSVALTWLLPWSGTDSLLPDALDPFFIEICRRVRLVDDGGRIIARETGSKAPRIDAGFLRGRTGDPWAPLDKRDGGLGDEKAVSLMGRGFPYDFMCDLMFNTKDYRPAPLQAVQPDDAEEGLVVVAAGIARGQGKTEGYHERRVPLSRQVQILFARRDTDRLARMAQHRVARIGDVSRILRRSLFVLAQEGKRVADLVRDHKGAAAIARPWLDRFRDLMDARFFRDLWDEVEAVAPKAEKIHDEWLVDIADVAEGLLTQAGETVPSTSMRRLKARAQAAEEFSTGRYRFLKDHTKRQGDDDADR